MCFGVIKERPGEDFPYNCRLVVFGQCLAFQALFPANKLIRLKRVFFQHGLKGANQFSIRSFCFFESQCSSHSLSLYGQHFPVRLGSGCPVDTATTCASREFMSRGSLRCLCILPLYSTAYIFTSKFQTELLPSLPDV